MSTHFKIWKNWKKSLNVYHLMILTLNKTENPNSCITMKEIKPRILKLLTKKMLDPNPTNSTAYFGKK